MPNIIDLEQRRLKKRAREKGIEYEIFLTVVNYVKKHANDTETDNPDDFMTTYSQLEDVYQGNHTQFQASFGELISYWNIHPLKFDISFEAFHKIEDLCWFIEQNIHHDRHWV